MFDWMEFSLDIWHLAGVQSLFAVTLCNTIFLPGIVVLSAQAVQTIIRSPALVVDLLFKMELAFLHFLSKQLSVGAPLGIPATLYQWCSKVANYVLNLEIKAFK